MLIGNERNRATENQTAHLSSFHIAIYENRPHLVETKVASTIEPLFARTTKLVQKPAARSRVVESPKAVKKQRGVSEENRHEKDQRDTAQKHAGTSRKK